MSAGFIQAASRSPRESAKKLLVSVAAFERAHSLTGVAVPGSGPSLRELAFETPR